MLAGCGGRVGKGVIFPEFQQRPGEWMKWNLSGMKGLVGGAQSDPIIHPHQPSCG